MARVALWVGRQAIEIAGETASDVLFYGRDFGSSLLINSIASVVGEGVIRGLLWGGSRVISRLAHTHDGLFRAFQPRARQLADFFGIQACFTGDMKVLTSEGLKRWDEITELDSVASSPEDNPNAPVDFKKVDLVVRRVALIWHVHINGSVIRTTGEHPFYVWGEGWVAARELRPGDRLRSLSGNEATVEEVFETQTYETVYNCQVADYHTYFVAPAGGEVVVWAHNIRVCSADEAAEAGLRIGRATTQLQRHHPTMSMILRAMRNSGMFPEVTTASGRLRSQFRDLLSISEHGSIHRLWNDFVADRGFNVLQNLPGNTTRLTEALLRGRISPTDIFGLLDDFYSRPDVVNEIGMFALWSVRNLGSRLGMLP